MRIRTVQALPDGDDEGGLAVSNGDLEAARQWVFEQTGPTAIDLFCGAGGLSLGLRDAGFSVLVGADSDQRSVDTHRRNIGGIGWLGDLAQPDRLVADLKRVGIRRVDLVAGGVPCQPFSRAGRSKIRSLIDQGSRDADDSRADLWESFVAIVRALKPAAVLLENVPDLAVWNDGSVLIGVSESLRALGFRTDAVTLEAFRFGVPQHRTRLFVVGVRPGRRFQWPAPSAPQGAPTVADAINDLPEVSAGHRADKMPYGGAKSGLQGRLRREVSPHDKGTVYDHITRPVRQDDAEAFALLREGGTYATLPPRLQRYRADIFKDKYKRLEWNGLSRSITAHLAKDGYWYIHPSQNRTLSVREAARIQTFPDWFRFCGPISAQFKQIGNAVPPLLAESIGRQLWASLVTPAIRGRPRGPTLSARHKLSEWHEKHSRSYWWRRQKDPWLVLMAEMCLRRTRADQVEAVIGDVATIAPTPAAAVERRDDVLAALKPLGLEWRAHEVVEVAEALLSEHGGVVPQSEAELLGLPGVGQYVANAVLCFAFNRRTVILDTNTERIVNRVYGRGVRRRWQMRLDLYRLAGRGGADGAFNYALLDLGALVCRPVAPQCKACPLQAICASAIGAGTARSPVSVREQVTAVVG